MKILSENLKNWKTLLKILHDQRMITVFENVNQTSQFLKLLFKPTILRSSISDSERLRTKTSQKNSACFLVSKTTVSKVFEFQ